MRYILSLLTLIVISSFAITSGYAQDDTSKGTSMEKSKVVMHRYLVERTFPGGVNIPMTDVGKDICIRVVSTNAEDQVTWIQSYVSQDKKKTFCIYDAPSADAIMRAAKQNSLPVDKITEVTVLEPYFYK